MYVENVFGVHVQVFKGCKLCVVVEGTTFFVGSAYLLRNKAVSFVATLDLGECVRLHACALSGEVGAHSLWPHGHARVDSENCLLLRGSE